MAKAKTASAKKSSSSKKAKEPIVEIDGVELAENAPSNEEPKSATPPETPVVAEPSPNVIWSSERIYKQVTKDGEKETVAWVNSPTETDREGKLKHGNPPAVVKIGITPVPVPDADKQLAGFYSKDAARLVRAIPGYKFLKPKG